MVRALLAVPKGPANRKGKGKKGDWSGSVNSTAANGKAKGDVIANGSEKGGPKSRLARAVRYLVEEDPRGEDERRKEAVELNEMMELVGVGREHVLRRKLVRFAAREGT